MAGLGRRVAALVSGGVLVAAGLAVAPAFGGDDSTDAIAGPLTSGDSLFPNQGNGGYDVSHYDLDIEWTQAVPISQSTIDATATISATTTGEPLSSFGLDLEGLTVTSVMVDGVPASEFHRLQADPNGTEPPPMRKLVVTPADPVSGPFTVVVDYGGVPTTHFDNDGSIGGWIKTSDGATFLNQPTGSMTGFPNNNTPKDKATYTFTVTVPDSLEVVSNGELTSNTLDGTRRTWVWDRELPMASELSLISIGQYTIITTPVSLSDNRTIPQWSFVDTDLSVPSAIAQLSTTLTALEGLFGRYPGNSTGVVVDDLNTGYALETQDRPFFPGSIGQNTFVHELAHQWYGDAVAPADWNGLWVNEGMATWAPTRLSGNTQTTYFNLWNNPQFDWSVPPSGMTSTQQLFGSQSYQRGAMTYEALRATIGDPAFFQLIKKWQTDYTGQTKLWTDLIALAEQLSGQDLTAFFQDWLCDADKPEWPPAAPTPGGTACALASTGPPPTGPPPTGPPPVTPATFAAACQVDITGRAKVGRKLTARLTGCPAAATVTSYQWFVRSRPIGGATTATYKLKRSKLGKRISVHVTVSAPGYVPAERVSSPTRKVR